MKKLTRICLIIGICASMLFSASCGNRIEGANMNDSFFDGFITDDSKSLESTLTKEYDLTELKLFFENSNTNENIVFDSLTSVLTFSEVNHQYPVEIVRTGGYSVYRVKQGGYFYVFWIKPLATDSSQANIEPSVYFTAYLPSFKDSSIFDSLEVGISTAKDVKSIDSSFELSFLMSNGVFSYSLLNEETVLEIEYAYQGKIDGYDDLIVKDMEIVSRASAPSRYSAILSSDLP